MTDNYQKLREIIIAANPEIMELKFGCEVSAGKVILCELRELTNDYAVNVIDNNGYSRTYIVTDIYSEQYQNQILGREIRLADVLNAIRKIRLRNIVDFGKRFTELTDIDYSPESLYFFVVENWNLAQDSLYWHKEHQPKTVKWLEELLIKE